MVSKRREMRTGHARPAGGRLVRLLLVDAHEPTGLLIRKRRQQDRLDDAEHRGRSADAQGERDDDDRGEAGTAPELSKRVARVLPGRLDPPDAVHPVDLLGDEGDVSQLPPCRGVRVLYRHAGADVSVNQQLVVGVELGSGFIRQARASADKPEPPDPGHHVRPDAPRAAVSFGHTKGVTTGVDGSQVASKQGTSDNVDVPTCPLQLAT